MVVYYLAKEMVLPNQFNSKKERIGHVWFISFWKLNICKSEGISLARVTANDK